MGSAIVYNSFFSFSNFLIKSFFVQCDFENNFEVDDWCIPLWKAPVARDSPQMRQFLWILMVTTVTVSEKEPDTEKAPLMRAWWVRIMLEEAHQIKNVHATATKAIRNMHARLQQERA